MMKYMLCRIVWIYTCMKCRHALTVPNALPQSAKKCPLCGGTLVGRETDDGN